MSENTRKIITFFSILGIGIVFGIALTKSEIISWFRIQEMFRFQSFHMYGVIGTAVVLGIIINQVFQRLHVKNIEGKDIVQAPKAPSIVRYLIGGTIFGLGWAMTGACPGPLYILVGSGYTAFLMGIFGAILGTFVYGLVRNRLPH